MQIQCRLRTYWVCVCDLSLLQEYVCVCVCVCVLEFLCLRRRSASSGDDVRQGCLLSPSLFNLFLELIMKDVRNLDSGIQMGHMHLNNIRYADDNTLLDHDVDHLQIATDKLEQACKKWGMKINTSKCKVISSDKRNITINGEAIETVTVDKFTFLGSSVPAVADVQRRINLAAWTFGRLRDKIWSR